MAKFTKVAQEKIDNSSTNKGYRIKKYYLNLEIYKVSDVSKCPNQVKLMLTHMSENFNKIETSSQGKIIVESCIQSGNLKTVIDPAVLFAYYRKYMENFGLTLSN